MEEGR